MAHALLPDLDNLLRDLAERQLCRQRAAAATRPQTKQIILVKPSLSESIGRLLDRSRAGGGKQPTQTVLLNDTGRETIATRPTSRP
jgi:hypothetical protein